MFLLDRFLPLAVLSLAFALFPLPVGAQVGTDRPSTPFAFADFNGDGKIDLVTVGEGGATVLYGNGDGTFRRDTGLFAPGGGSPLVVAAADFNGDGKADVVMQCSIGVMTLFLGNGDRSFQSPIQFSEPVKISSTLLAADLTGDGVIDLFAGGIISPLHGPNIGSLKNNGAGVFSVATKNNPGWVEAAAIGDLNGDHIPDVLVHSPTATSSLFWAKAVQNWGYPESFPR